jgi:hypothetical protein
MEFVSISSIIVLLITFVILRSFVVNPMLTHHLPPCDDILTLKEKVASLEIWRTSTETERQERHRLPGLQKTQSSAGSRKASDARHYDRVRAYANTCTPKGRIPRRVASAGFYLVFLQSLRSLCYIDHF